jgi:hypothetical protein
MKRFWSERVIRQGVAATFALLIALPASFAQAPADASSGMPDQQQAAPLLSPDQLDNLVAPVALYPDPLLGQVMAASTYPLEIVEAARWLQQNRGLQGAQLIEAARQQNWDPSVSALVAFPDVLNLLNNDIRWTTDLGNAFLAQQADVMAAVQMMRARAQANGKLRTTPQEVVTTDNQNGQPAIQIQPADPQVIYVPVYQPEYIWGPAAWGAYPSLWYPSAFGFGFGFGWGPGIYMGGFFPGWYGWGGWGWDLGWGHGGLFVNAGFFSRWGFGYRGFGGYGLGGRALWAHDPGHRLGVAYSNRAVAARFGSNGFAGSRFAGAARNGSQVGGTNRGANAYGGQHFGSANRGAANGYANSYRGGMSNGAGSSGAYRGNNTQSYRGSSPAQGSNPAQGNRGGQSYSAPRSQSFSGSQSHSAPQSAPRSSGGSFSGGHSGFSGGHAGGGGGHGRR